MIPPSLWRSLAQLGRGRKGLHLSSTGNHVLDLRNRISCWSIRSRRRPYVISVAGTVDVGVVTVTARSSASIPVESFNALTGSRTRREP